MINHVRTLLLNETDNKAGISTGLPYAEIIDPSFTPITIPTVLKEFYSILYPSSTISNKLIRTRCIIGLIHLDSFDIFTRSLDSRITYDFSGSFNTDIDFNITSFIDNVDRSNLSVGLLDALFKGATTSDEIADLYRIWASGISKLNRCTATVMAYAYQCDRLLVK